MPTPIVLIHGFTDAGETWDEVIPDLEAAGYEAHAIQLGGHSGGRPLADGELPTLELLADMVAQDIAELGVERPHLVGNSLGGWIALALAARGQAASVTALAPIGGWQPGSIQALWLKLFFTGNLMALPFLSPVAGLLASTPLSRRFMLGTLANHGERVSPKRAASVVANAKNTPIFGPFLATIFTQELHEPLRGITCPVTIAWSQRDRILAGSSFRPKLAELVPDATIMELPGVGHMPMLEAPHTVAEVILDVTEAVDAPSLEHA